MPGYKDAKMVTHSRKMEKGKVRCRCKNARGKGSELHKVMKWKAR